MNKLFSILAFLFISSFSEVFSQDDIRYYFKTLDNKEGLSHNTVQAILQDRQGIMWFGTKDGLNRFDGLKFRVFKRDNSNLGNNYITALFEDKDGKIWIGTDAGVYLYDPEKEQFSAFDKVSENGSTINRAVTRITGDSNNNIWISVDYQGLFCYDYASQKLINSLYQKEGDPAAANVSCFWFEDNTIWVGLYADNLYYTKDNFETLVPFKDPEGKELFKGDVIETQLVGPHNCWYIGSASGLTEINLTTLKVRRLLSCYVRDLRFRSDSELWVGSESGLYIYDLIHNTTKHIEASDGNDPYALADNAIYSVFRDKEGGVWIGSYFGGINYYPHQYSYFEKYYPRDDLKNIGRRIREFCGSNDNSVWIATEDRGLFHFNPVSKEITPFVHPYITNNVNSLCLDGNDLWVGMFSGGLGRIDLRTKQVRHYTKGPGSNSLGANSIFAIYKTTSGDLWIGTILGLYQYNRETDDFTQIRELSNVNVYNILEDFNGNIWVATYANGVFRYDIRRKEWKNFISKKDDPTSIPYDKVISIFEDSKKRLWFMTHGMGICQYDPSTDGFIRYDISKNFPCNITYRMVEDFQKKLWLTTNDGLVCFDPDTDYKRIYTTSDGLLSNQFNYQSGYRDKEGRIYMGSIDGFIMFNPLTFSENKFVPPVLITDFLLFNKRIVVGGENSPLQKSIMFSDNIKLRSDQNSFSLHVAALSYQAPEMNQLIYRLDNVDQEWHTVEGSSNISYSNLPYGKYVFRLKGSNNSDKWSETERVLNIEIRPPFYLSELARATYILLSMLIIVATVYFLQRKAKRKQQQAMETLERKKDKEVYASKIDFFTNVAHEIRTPLTLIKGPLENVLGTESLSEEIRDDLEIMDLNTKRLLDLVNQLLNFRKAEINGFQMCFVECNISDILQQTYKRFIPLSQQKGLEYVIEEIENINASVDREALIKIISNLFTNAIKYSDTYIHIRLWTENNHLLLSVCNDGEIVPMEMREEIFNPFVQYKNSRTDLVTGTGIGLALARSLVELHDGTLCMDNSLEYNRFILSLPMKQEHGQFLTQNEANIELKVDDPDGDDQNENQDHRYLILVVEDNLEMLTFVAKQLSPIYRILTATNGKEALEVLKIHMVHLIVSDIMMPEMDGLELCDYIKSDLDYSHIPIIMLTAKATLQAKIEGLKFGADAYIEKPFSIEYLKTSIANLLSNREKIRAVYTHSPFIQTSTVAITDADRAFMDRLKEVLDANIQEPDFCLDDMASLLNMSRSSLNRKIKGLLDMTPNDYIRLERLKKAAYLLKNGEFKVNEVCYMVGFNTPSYFTKCFLKQFGVLPKDF